jgi:hypothetical protein
VLVGEFPTHQVRSAGVEADLAARFPPNGQTEAGRQGSGGRRWREARADDGSTPNETQPAGSGPDTGPHGPAFVPNLSPALADSSVYVGTGPAPWPASTTPRIREVKLLGMRRF